MNNEDFPYPPYLYSIQVLDYLPDAASTFFMLWKDYYDLPPNQRRLNYDKQVIEHDRYLKWSKFNKDLNQLGRIGLLQRTILDDKRISVELSEWYDG